MARLPEIPRYQILTTEAILEHGKKPIIPAGYGIPPQASVG